MGRLVCAHRVNQSSTRSGWFAATQGWAPVSLCTARLHVVVQPSSSQLCWGEMLTTVVWWALPKL